MIDGSAYLQISSATRTAASIAEALGIPGAEMAEKGDPRLNVEGNPVRGPRPFYEYAFWSVSVDGDEAAPSAPDDDPAGFTSLRLLVAQFAGKAPILSELRGTGEYRMVLSLWGYIWEQPGRLCSSAGPSHRDRRVGLRSPWQRVLIRREGTGTTSRLSWLDSRSTSRFRRTSAKL